MLIEELDRNRHNLENIRELLVMAIGQSTPERLKQLVEDFYAVDGRTLFVAVQDDKTIGLIGMVYGDGSHGVIAHLAVHPDKRRQGIGHQLIDNTVAILGLKDIEAETDQDAVEFYRACGFETKEIESQYPGVRRFRCVRNTSIRQA
jgi:ribosomal protein S18 acetylase RimI-like enzyme